jgi:hypothetical protein
MLKFYLGVAIMCVVFAVFAAFFSEHALILSSIFLAIGLVFAIIAVLARGAKWRW